jgi:hypothetical protein
MTTTHANPTRDEVLALERSFWDAMKQKDGARAAKLSGKTSLVTGAQGVMSIPRARMAKMTEEGAWTLESYSFADIEVGTPAPDVAIIAYKVTETVRMDGKLQELHAADSSTWVRGEQGWECCAHSETMLPDAKTH